MRAVGTLKPEKEHKPDASARRQVIRIALQMRCLYILAVLCLLVIAGCGGGGGPAVQTFVYKTHWITPSGGVDGQSQSIQLSDANNIVKYTATFDKPAISKTIFGVANGTYHIHVTLYALTAGQGAITGTLDDLVTISGSTIYETTVGPAVTSVDIKPPSATIEVQHSQQFYATSRTSANLPTFTAPGGFAWATLGGVASVDSNGLVVGTSAGPGSVTATNSSASVTGAATLTVQNTTTTTGKWTVIVFMNAANDLWSFSILNMNQMEMVAQNPNVRFVVEWKQSTSVDSNSTFNSTRRYLVKPDATNAIASEVVQDLGPGYDMGSANSLLDFINWAKTNYPATHYCLVLWDHGNGWKRAIGHGRGVSYDDESGNHIDTWDLTPALGNGTFDIVAWDSSLMQQLEVSDEIRSKATYVVGSEESPPQAGYPYDRIFAHFRDNPDDTVLSLSKNFVDETIAYYGSSGNITQSVIDTTQLPSLVTSTSALSDALIANVGSLGTIAPQVRASAQAYSNNSVNGHYRDLYDVCLKLENFGAPTAVITAEQSVRAAVSQAVVYEGHNANSQGSHGVSIDFSSSSQFASLANDYQNLRFGQETHWGQWLSVAP